MLFVDPLAAIPPPAERRLALRVTPAGQRALRAGHPWLFDQAITGRKGEGRPGDLAVIFDEQRRFLAIGLYDPTSPIRVRVLQHGTPATIDRAWLAEKVTAAAAWRATLSESGWAAEGGTTGYRLVHGENDGLPGLVIDRYADVLVLKLYTAAWVPWLADLRAALVEVGCVSFSGRAGILSGAERSLRSEVEGCGSVAIAAPASTAPRERLRGSAQHAPLLLATDLDAPESPPTGCVVLRLSRDVRRRPEFLCGLDDGAVLAGALPSGPVQFRENGLRFEADVLAGQKTGFFFDQRDNRARAGKLAAGRRTLNVFAYTGGFSLYAARGGAPEVLSIDSSAPALAAAERNFALNRDLPAVAACRHTILAADAFDALADLRMRGERFELVIVDPPAFAKREDEVSGALQSYGRLTGLALGVLASGGRLVMASCSSRVSAPDFFATVNRAAAHAGRPLVEIDRTGHAIDHSIRFPEGAYLKCLFATAA